MPCHSIVTKTKITDSVKLLSALKALGIRVNKGSNDLYIDTDIGTFQRSNKSHNFDFGGTQGQLAEVGRKYAEITVREWGVRNGMGITDIKGQKITLQKRR